MLGSVAAVARAGPISGTEMRNASPRSAASPARSSTSPTAANQRDRACLDASDRAAGRFCQPPGRCHKAITDRTTQRRPATESRRDGARTPKMPTTPGTPRRWTKPREPDCFDEVTAGAASLTIAHHPRPRGVSSAAVGCMRLLCRLVRCHPTTQSSNQAHRLSSQPRVGTGERTAPNASITSERRRWHLNLALSASSFLSCSGSLGFR
jgi:hypothetical protein